MRYSRAEFFACDAAVDFMVGLRAFFSWVGLTWALSVLSACTLVTHNSEAEAENLSLVCIVEKSDKAVPKLMEALERRLADQGIESQRGVGSNGCKHTLEYTAQESDDSRHFLKNAHLTLRENGQSIGTVKYRDRGGPAEKRAESLNSKVVPLVDALLGLAPDSNVENTDLNPSSAIVQACTDLVLEYARHRDEHNVESLVNLFTEDARMTVMGAALVGTAAIKERTQSAAQGPRTRHLMSAVNVEVVSESRAVGKSYVTVYAAPADDSADARPVLDIGEVAVVGYYIDEFKRTATGWRIATRRLVTDYVSSSAN